jgi:O-antigen/teichoic acid export membrane protein
MWKHLRQLTKESVIYGFSGAMTAIVGIVLVPLYTKTFAPEQYGIIDIVTSTMNVLTILAVLGLDNSAHRWYWQHDDEQERRRTVATWAWSNIATNTFVGALIFAFAPVIARLLSSSVANADYFRLGALTLPLGALAIVTSGWLRMRRQPYLAVVFTVTTNLAIVAMSILFVKFLHWGLHGVMWGLIAGDVAVTLMGLWLLRDVLRPGLFDSALLPEMLRYSMPLLPAALAGWAITGAGRYFLLYLTGTQGQHNVGLYAAGSKVATIAFLVTVAFQTAWGPFAMSLHKRVEAQQVYAGAMLLYVWVMGLLATAITLFARDILRVVTKPEYFSAEPVIGLLAFSFIFIGLKFISSIGLNIVKDTRPIGLAVSIAFIAFVGFALVLVPRYGIVGAALSTLLSQALIPLYLFQRAQRQYPVPYKFGTAGLILFIAALASWIGYSAGLHGWQGALLKLGLLAVVALTGLLLRDSAHTVEDAVAAA